MGLVCDPSVLAAAFRALGEALGASPRLLVFAGAAAALSEPPPPDALVLIDATLPAPVIASDGLDWSDPLEIPALAAGRPAWWRLADAAGDGRAQGPASQLRLSRPVFAAGQPLRLAGLRVTAAAAALPLGGWA